MEITVVVQVAALTHRPDVRSTLRRVAKVRDRQHHLRACAVRSGAVDVGAATLVCTAPALALALAAPLGAAEANRSAERGPVRAVTSTVLRAYRAHDSASKLSKWKVTGPRVKLIFP